MMTQQPLHASGSRHHATKAGVAVITPAGPHQHVARVRVARA